MKRPPDSLRSFPPEGEVSSFGRPRGTDMFPLPLVIETQASTSLKALLLAGHLTALVALFLALLPAPARVTGLALLGASLWANWPRPVAVRLRAKADGKLEIWRDADWKPLQLRADSVALPWLIVLRWREGRRRHSLALPADALPGDEHRRLRVWLRWKAGFAAPPPQDVVSAANRIAL